MPSVCAAIGLVDKPLAADWPGSNASTPDRMDVMVWKRHARRLVQLYVGLWLYGFGAALQVRAGLGLDPWDVFHQGGARHLGLAIGTVLIIVGALVLLLWIPLRQRPGLGTVSNALLIGVALNNALDWLPDVHAVWLRILTLVIGIVLGGSGDRHVHRRALRARTA